MEAINKVFHPVYVVTNTRRYKDRVYTTHLLRHSYPENGQVKKITGGNLYHLPDYTIEVLRLALRSKPLVSANTLLPFQRTLLYGHVAAVLGTIRAIGISRMLAALRSVPSASAWHKATTRRTAHGHPTHHFRGLLGHLGTLCRNSVAIKQFQQHFSQLTESTELPRTAFELLHVKI